MPQLISADITPSIASVYLAFQRVETCLGSWASDSGSYNALLREVFEKESTSAANAKALLAQLRGTGLGISVEILGGAILSGNKGAYTNAAPEGGERIYLNNDWLQSATPEQIEAVLLEEIGHAIDIRLNGQSDSPGDEGEIFSSLIRGINPNPAATTENDQSLITINGHTVAIEASADTTAPSGNSNLHYPIYSTGSQSPFGLIKSSAGFGSVSLVDIDGDGDLDVFSGSTDGEILYYKNTSGTSTPAYAAETKNPFGILSINGGGDSKPILADIDGDLDFDLITGGSGGPITIQLNTGTRTNPVFGSASINPYGITSTSGYAIPTLVDSDGDGDLDLFVGNNLGNVLFFRNSGSSVAPRYEAAITNPFGISDVGDRSAPTFADVDLDSDLDLLVGRSDGNILYFENTKNASGDPAYRSPTFLRSANNTGDASPALADLTGDGTLDLLVSNGTRFYLNTGIASASLIPVTSTTTNGSYGPGAVITLALQFSEVVFVTGLPRLQLETGANDKYATYISGSGSANLSFQYTVAAGDSSTDLDQLSSSALTLNSGTIKDAAGNNALLELAEPGSTGSLASNAQIIIDTISPRGTLALPGGNPAAFAAPSSSPFGIGVIGISEYASPSFADIDNDGDLDLFIGNKGGSTLFFQNTGTRTAPSFSASSSSPFGIGSIGSYQYASPELADIDNDGDLDLFIGNKGGSTLFFQNTGTRTAPSFSASSSSLFGIGSIGSNQYASPELADIDNDGDLDLFIGTRDGSTLFFQNTGTRTAPSFSASSSSPFGIGSIGSNQYASPELADIDNDGDLDLFIGTRDGSTLFFQNTGTRTAPSFSASSSSPFGIGVIGSYSCASPGIADIDNDGDLDLFIGTRDGSTLFLQNTAVTYVAPVTSTKPNGTYGVGTVITLNVEFSESVTVQGLPRLQLETGATDQYATYSGGSGSNTLSFAYTVQAGDTSADLDQLSSSALTLNGGTIKDAAGNNALLTLANPGATGSLAANAQLLIDTTAPTGSLGSYATTPAYSAAVTNPYGITNVGNYSSPALADIDRDGDLDLFIGNYSGNTLLFRNTAASGATTPAYSAASTNPYGITNVGTHSSPAFADIDRDGDLDLFIGNYSGNTLLFRNTAASGDTTPAYSAASTNPYGINDVGNQSSPAFADIDGDGDLDLFIGNKDGNTLVFTNTAASGATIPAYSAAVTNPYGITDVGGLASPAFADIDGDGDLDLFIGNFNGNTLVFTNTAAAGATTPAYSAAVTNPFSVTNVDYLASPTFADIDRDGDLDLFIGNNSGDTLLFRNTATTPVAPVVSTTTNGSYGIGSVITITVGFSEAVLVTGIPQLQLETGSTDRYATYSSGSNSPTLSFQYTVQAGDTSADLDQLSSSALTLNGGTIKDAAGNNAILTLANPAATGSLAANAQLVIDTTAPTANFTSATDNVGSITGTLASGATTDDTTLVLTGTNESGSSVAVYNGTSLLGSATVSGTSWTYAALIANSTTYNFNVKETDRVGNTSAATSNFTITGDTSAPVAPTNLDLIATADTGSSNSDNITNLTTPTITGSAEQLSTVVLYDTNGSTSLGSATASATGAWSITSSALTAGVHSLTAKATDLAGNTSIASAALSITVDTIVPAIPTALDLLAASDTGSSNTDNITFLSTHTITGTADPLSTVVLYDTNGSTSLGSATASATGAWSITSSALTAGVHSLTAKATDLAGNTSIASTALGITIDQTSPIPIPTSITSTSPNGNPATITISVPFSEIVFVTGNLTVQLRSNNNITRTASYKSGSGTNTLSFDYILQPSDLAAFGSTISISGLSLLNGTIKDNAGNNAILTLSTPISLNLGSIGPSSPFINPGSFITNLMTNISFNENITAGSTVATLSTIDTNANNSYTYSLASGAGDTNNSAFTISGNHLKINTSPDYETKSAYTIRLRTTDQRGQFSEKAVSLAVADQNETPTALILSATSFNENIAASSTVATLSSIDPDNNSFHTYSLVVGNGDKDNQDFQISGNQLKIKASPDYETKSFYEIRLRTTDSSNNNLNLEQNYRLNVNDLQDNAIPEIAVKALANGNEANKNPAIFEFTRTGSTAAPLSFNYQLFGTAQSGSDYNGNTTGTLTFATGSSSSRLQLPAIADGQLIDPGETIIARINNPANANYKITPGKQTATATIIAEGMDVYIKESGESGFKTGIKNNAFAALKPDGSVVAWGNAGSGGSAPTGLSGVTQITSNNYAFAALKSDGSVVAWGNQSLGGSAPTGLSGVTQITSNNHAFAALKSDGSVVAWGYQPYGGSAPTGLSGVTQITSNNYAFAALKSDGSVVAWGYQSYGGSAPTGLSGVTQITSNNYAFTALKSDGSVVAWGYQSYGGSAPTGLSGVTQITSNNYAFAALKSDGSVVAWGNQSYGGRAPTGLSGVTQITSNNYAFAALKSDGSVVAWGYQSYGGNAPTGLSGVTQITSNIHAFAALKSDGSVVAWGYQSLGGSAPTGLSGVTQITSNNYAFAALKSDGSVVAWGDPGSGGSAPTVLSGVTQITSNDLAFAALKSDGSVVAWGNQSHGGSAPTELNNIVGLVNDNTDDRLIILPQVSVKAISNGNESNVIPNTAKFQFNRTGSTANALSISYHLFGTAMAGTDYSGNRIGTISFAPGSSTTTLSLSAIQDGALIDPNETIIVKIDVSNSNTYTTAPAQQIAASTITAEGMEVTLKGPTRPGHNGGEYLNGSAFAALTANGRVVTWGDAASGGDSSGVANNLKKVIQLYSNKRAFAALTWDNKVITWGDSSYGGNLDASQTTQLLSRSRVDKIFSSESAFAALRADGSVFAWGDAASGGDSNPVSSKLQAGVVQIYSTNRSFAALKTDGSVVTWGDSSAGGDSSAVTNLLQAGVVQIYSTNRSFAALKTDGSVVTWGDGSDGGNSNAVTNSLQAGVVQIYSTNRSFAALKADGSVVTWGDGPGGDSTAVVNDLKSGVSLISSTGMSFAALKSNGSVISWGDAGFWTGQLRTPAGLSSVDQIFANDFAFAALKSDGSVISWGSTDIFGTPINQPQGLTGVTQIYFTSNAFAALKTDGSVVTWGNAWNGGDSSLVTSQLNNITQIFSTNDSFAALKSDGTVVSWGKAGAAPLGLNSVVGFANPFTSDIRTSSTGFASDGYVRGAQIFLETPNGLLALPGIITDGFGKFNLPNDANPNSYPLVAIGGINIDTGLPQVIPIKAPADSTTINPITTLISVIIESSPGTSASDASAKVANSLGLTNSLNGASLFTFNPLGTESVENTSVQKIAAQIAAIITLAVSESTSNQANSDIQTIFRNIGSEINAASINSLTINLSDPQLISQALSNINISTGILTSIQLATQAISSATNLLEISAIQSHFLDKISPDAPLGVTATRITNNPTPNIKVELNTSSLDGKAAAVNDIIKLSDGVSQIASYAINSIDNINGYATISAPTLSEGVHYLSALICDQAGNVSLSSSVCPIDIDTTAPSVATLLLDSDTGASSSDGITSNGKFNVLLPSDTAYWQYSNDAGNSWANGLGTSFLLAAGIYDPESIQIKVFDAAINSSLQKNYVPYQIGPTSLNISKTSFSENIPTETVVATLSIQNPDIDNTYTYSLAEGVGSADNQAFTIDGNKVLLVALSDFESKDLYSIRLRVSDQAGLSFEREVTLTVVNSNEAPKAINLSAISFSENIGSGGTVAILSTLDTDSSDTHTYSLVTGSGSIDNSVFSISGDQLNISPKRDQNIKSSYSIRLRSTDQGNLSIEREVTIFLDNGNQLKEASFPSTNGQFVTTLRPNSGSIDGNIHLNRLDSSPIYFNQGSDLQIGQIGINFSLKLDKSTTDDTARATLDLIPLFDGLSTTNKRLAYFVYDSPVVGAAPVATPFTYDPIKKAGARFYDLDGNGTPDTADLQFIDGGYGDKDGVKNGVVVDPSTPGVVSLIPIFTATATALTVGDPTDSTSPAALTVRATLTAKAASVNQIGYVALNANEADTLTYELVRDRGSILLANLESSDTPNVAAMKFQRDINLINGQKLVFFEVVDTTLESLLAKNTTLQGFGSSFRTLDLTKSTDIAATASKGGNTVALSLLDDSAIAGLGDLISSQMADTPILDFTGLAGRTLEGSTVSLAREANYDTTIGFYRIQRADGAVLDPITNALITPGSAGYRAAALSSTNLFSGFGTLAVANGATRTDKIAAFNESGLLAPYATVAQTGDTFFSFRSANSDNLNHFRVLGSGVIGLEDLNGGGDQDFDDNIVSFIFKLKQGTLA